VIPLETVLIFVAASVALALVPGPDNIFVLTQSALHGRKAGIIVTLGLCSGLILHTTAVSLGVAVIFQTSAMAFNVLKVIGALYLLFLAWQAFRAGRSKFNSNENPVASSRALYVRGFVMNITNPKVAIFFLAFLPQFADPSRGSLTAQMFILGGIMMLVTLVVFSSVGWTAGFLGDWLRRSKRAQVMLNRIAAMVFLSLALRLATIER
jgi:threonine/homoserine/homoserine lactone efflux protein